MDNITLPWNKNDVLRSCKGYANISSLMLCIMVCPWPLALQSRAWEQWSVITWLSVWYGWYLTEISGINRVATLVHIICYGRNPCFAKKTSCCAKMVYHLGEMSILQYKTHGPNILICGNRQVMNECMLHIWCGLTVLCNWIALYGILL